jgi:hypothetical protein
MGKCIFDEKETSHYLSVDGKKIFVCEDCVLNMKSPVFGYAFPPLQQQTSALSVFKQQLPNKKYVEQLEGLSLKIGDKVRIIGGSIAIGEEGTVKGFVIYDKPIDFTGAIQFVLVETKVTSIVEKQVKNVKKIDSKSSESIYGKNNE